MTNRARYSCTSSRKVSPSCSSCPTCQLPRQLMEFDISYSDKHFLLHCSRSALEFWSQQYVWPDREGLLPIEQSNNWAFELFLPDSCSVIPFIRRVPDFNRRLFHLRSHNTKCDLYPWTLCKIPIVYVAKVSFKSSTCLGSDKTVAKLWRWSHWLQCHVFWTIQVSPKTAFSATLKLLDSLSRIFRCSESVQKRWEQ